MAFRYNHFAHYNLQVSVSQADFEPTYKVFKVSLGTLYLIALHLWISRPLCGIWADECYWDTGCKQYTVEE